MAYRWKRILTVCISVMLVAGILCSETAAAMEMTGEKETRETVMAVETSEVQSAADTESVEETQTIQSVEDTESIEETQTIQSVENTESKESIIEETVDSVMAFSEEILPDVLIDPQDVSYSIVQQGNHSVTVVLEHYELSTGQPIYAQDIKTLDIGERIEDYRKADNYSVSKVTKVTADGEEELPAIGTIKVSENVTLRIYYEPITKQNVYGGVKVYDYQIAPASGKGINADSHYSQKDTNNRMTMGTKEANAGRPAGGYNAYGTNKLNANNCNYKKSTNGFGTLGLLAGLTDDFNTVLWNVDQPGFFTDENEGEGKDIFTNYGLYFVQEGNHYKLDTISNGSKTTAVGQDFWPIENPKKDKVSGDKYYFGMRYDIEFTLGDYTGPLEYTFSGDDDLWVLLDGEVVIDVGGIHDAITQSTNLWEDLGYREGARPQSADEKSAIHRITVLYMERGAGASNCTMNFTLPQTNFLDVTKDSMGVLKLLKVNSKDEPLENAEFSLVNNDDENEIYEEHSDVEGMVSFANLRKGASYTLTEVKAPKDYVKPSMPWQVIVNEDGEGNPLVQLYDDSGNLVSKSDEGAYIIVNDTPQEILEKTLVVSKTAALDNWENRTYTIQLTAHAKVLDGRTQEEASVSLLEMSGVDTSIKNAVVTDVLADAFELLDDDGTPITEAEISEGKTLSNGATVFFDESQRVGVVWEDQTIPEESQGQWSATLHIRAKADFIGGNAIQTNISPDSAVTTELGSMAFPVPEVNVQMHLLVGNAEQTIFLGERVPVDNAIIKELFDQSAVTGMMYGEKVTYTDVDPECIQMNWYNDLAGTQQADLTEIGAVSPETERDFYLKVVYDAGEPTEQSTQSSAGNITGGESHQVTAVNGGAAWDDSLKDLEMGVYRIHVVYGTVTLTKNIDTQYSKIEVINANQGFVFHISRYDIAEDGTVGDLIETYQEVLNFSANQPETSKSVVLTHLPKGYYLVEEEQSWSVKYQLSGVLDTYETASDALMLIGKKDEEAYPSGSYYYGEQGLTSGDPGFAEVTFKNDRKDLPWPSDGALAVNRFIADDK